MRRLPALICAFVVVAPLAASDVVRVTASVPPRIVDGTEIKAIVTVEVVGVPEISLPAPTPHLTLRPAIKQLRDDNLQRCFSDAEQVISGTASTVTIRRGSPLRVTVDLLEFYPLGLAPGRYALTFVMDTGNAVSGPRRLRSEPVEFEVVAPEGTDRAKWEEFRKICSAVIARRPSASADALAFARKHGDYPLLPGLLKPAMERASDPVVRREIASLVEDRYPGTALAQQAAADRRWSDKRADALQKQQEHDAEIRRYLQQPANEAEARAYAKLGTISSASGFERHEAFVSRYPSSPLAAEALYSMIVALENGVAAPSRTGQSRESVLRSLRKRLVTEYPKSYRAREVMNADR